MRLYSLDEGLKSSSYLTETLLDPELGYAHQSDKTAFNKAHNVEEDFWSWLERPDNRLRLARLGAAMDGLKNATPANAILEGLIMLCFTTHHHLTLKYLFFRVCLGKPPRWLAGHRCWRRCWRAVLDAR
jgi:hypothetical protein